MRLAVTNMTARTKEERKRRKALRLLVPLVTIHGNRDTNFLLIILGYKGSVLARKVDGRENVVWLTATQAAGFSTPDLKLPMTWKEGIQDRDDIHPMHTMKAVTSSFCALPLTHFSHSLSL